MLSRFVVPGKKANDKIRKETRPFYTTPMNSEMLIPFQLSSSWASLGWGMLFFGPSTLRFSPIS
jgi:hypothetical protein